MLHRFGARIGYIVGLMERTELEDSVRTSQVRYEHFGETLRDFCEKMMDALPPIEGTSGAERFAETLDFIATRTDRTLSMHVDITNFASCIRGIAEAERTLQRDIEAKVLKPSRDFLENEWEEFKEAERNLATATVEMDGYKSKLTKLVKQNESYQKGYEKALKAYEGRLREFTAVVSRLDDHEKKHADRIKDAVDILIEYHALALRKFRIYQALS
uniref:BAR domain-containing protein n=1 Tax=Trichuris muris TaxID=70415 RepID=A0A5S6QSU4_TRIMR